MPPRLTAETKRVRDNERTMVDAWNSIRGCFSCVLVAVIVGPILSTYRVPSSQVDKADSNSGLYSTTVPVLIGLADVAVYSAGLWLWIQAVHSHDYQRVHMIIDEDTLAIEQINASMVSLTIAQATLYDLVTSFVQDNDTDPQLVKLTREKLRTLNFLYADDATSIESRIKKLDDDFQFLRINTSRLAPTTNDRLQLFIISYSFLLYIHQIALWICQYLMLRNPRAWSPYTCVLAIVLLSQSLGFIFFLLIINLAHFLSLLHTFTYLIAIRSLMSLYHYAYLPMDASPECRNRIALLT